MILMRERRAEQRHDPVAHNPMHGALVAVHRLNHALEHGVEELLRVFGVAVGKQLHRALDVGEQHGDLLALAFERGLGGEDLIDEVLGNVTFERSKAGIVCDPLQGMATLGAELGCGRRLASTVAAGLGQRSGTLLTELRVIRVIVLALRALHSRPRRKRRAGSTTTTRVTSGMTGNKVYITFPRGGLRMANNAGHVPCRLVCGQMCRKLR